LFWATAVFLNTDALDVDVRGFLFKQIVQLDELGNGNSAEAEAEVMVVEDLAFAGADGVDIGLS